MSYTAKNYEYLLGLDGFSDELLRNHFSLYQGYVKNTNQLMDQLSDFARKGTDGGPVFAELKRRFGWEFNGMRLHEYYFDNMGKNVNHLPDDSAVARKIEDNFNSFAQWASDFKMTGSIRGIGWTMLCYDNCGDRLLNVWINEHDVGHLAGLDVLLVMDVFEHAYMIDYGLKKADYIEAFFKVLNWDAVEKRFQIACSSPILGARK